MCRAELDDAVGLLTEGGYAGAAVGVLAQPRHEVHVSRHTVRGAVERRAAPRAEGRLGAAGGRADAPGLADVDVGGALVAAAVERNLAAALRVRRLQPAPLHNCALPVDTVRRIVLLTVRLAEHGRPAGARAKYGVLWAAWACAEGRPNVYLPQCAVPLAQYCNSNSGISKFRHH